MASQPDPVSPLTAHLGYWLRFVSNQVSHAFSLRLAAPEVTVAEWVVLRTLFDQDAAVPSALAEALGMTRGAVSKLADRLAAKGLLTQTVNPGDRRFQALTLTARGRALGPDLAALADANDAAFFGHLAPEERARIAAAMRDIVRRHGLQTVPTE